MSGGALVAMGPGAGEALRSRPSRDAAFTKGVLTGTFVPLLRTLSLSLYPLFTGRILSLLSSECVFGDRAFKEVIDLK